MDLTLLLEYGWVLLDLGGIRRSISCRQRFSTRNYG